MAMDPGERVPINPKSEEYKTQRVIVQNIIDEHRKNLKWGTPELNYCDDAVMHWRPPGCEELNRCLPVPPSDKKLCYWDH